MKDEEYTKLLYENIDAMILDSDFKNEKMAELTQKADNAACFEVLGDTFDGLLDKANERRKKEGERTKDPTWEKRRDAYLARKGPEVRRNQRIVCAHARAWQKMHNPR